jgi:hypothetical protein
MQTMKVLVGLSMLGMGSLLGCGGEIAEPADEGALQSVQQPVCTVPVSPGGCSGPIYSVDGALTCNHYDFTFTHYCDDGFGCRLWQCAGGSFWRTKAIGSSCGYAIQTSCQ